MGRWLRGSLALRLSLIVLLLAGCSEHGNAGAFRALKGDPVFTAEVDGATRDESGGVPECVDEASNTEPEVWRQVASPDPQAALERLQRVAAESGWTSTSSEDVLTKQTNGVDLTLTIRIREFPDESYVSLTGHVDADFC